MTLSPKVGLDIMLGFVNKSWEGVKINATKDFCPEQSIWKLQEAEVLITKVMATQQAARQIGVTNQTYYRWRKEYGGMHIEQAKRLKALEKENICLKRLVAEKKLDIQILKEAIAFESKNF